MKDQEEDVSRLAASLRSVEAPEGFEGSVRSRIAERRAQSSTNGPTIWLVAKFALPMLLLLVLGGVFVVSNDGVIDGAMVPPVGGTSLDVADLDPQDSGVYSANGSPKRSDEPVPQKQDTQSAAAPAQASSEDFAISSDNSIAFPDGVDPRKARNGNLPPPPTQRILPITILSFIGISGGCSPGSCIVMSVEKDSLADRSGVKPRDVVEAIDGRPIDSFHAFSGKVTVSRLSILRNGEKLSLSLPQN